MTDSPGTSTEWIDALIAQLRGTTAATRPGWWFDDGRHDRDAAARDDAGRDRDTAASARDDTARRRDDDAAARERAAVDLAVRAHARLTAEDAQGVAAQIGYHRDMEELQRVFNELRATPDVPGPVMDRLQHRLELLIDRTYVATLAMAAERDHARDDLRGIAAHLDAGVRDRVAAGHDRSDTVSDRHAAERDRHHARSARHRDALRGAAEDS